MIITIRAIKFTIGQTAKKIISNKLSKLFFQTLIEQTIVISTIDTKYKIVTHIFKLIKKSIILTPLI